MKTKILFLGLLGMFLTACNKAPLAGEKTSETQILDTRVMTYTNENGEKISIIYFADGDVAGVRLQKGDEEDRTLKAVLDTPSHNAIFSDGKITWEVKNENSAGELTDEQGQKTLYQRD